MDRQMQADRLDQTRLEVYNIKILEMNKTFSLIEKIHKDKQMERWADKLTDGLIQIGLINVQTDRWTCKHTD
jgi:hypothetical protein